MPGTTPPGLTRAYGVGITAATSFEKTLSTPELPTAVMTYTYVCPDKTVASANVSAVTIPVFSSV